MAKKKKKDSGGGPTGQEWLTTYSDMVTLVLCFFAIMFNPDEVTPSSMAQLSVSFMANGMGSNAGGNTIAVGRYAELGNNINSLPAMDKGKSLGTALRKATSIFAPEVKSKKMTVTSDERGVVISLASDAFFAPASAVINIESTRDILLRLGQILASSELTDRKFRVEGHTDSTPIDPEGPWESNWQLSAMRAINVLHYLTDLGISEKRFQVAGFADTMPVSRDDTPEGRAYNRRVDIIILDEAHL
ncbi:MAG: flagellar motor protein MotB [Spirochaetaceae bacterium]|jgi:chemotaxis protein MotB|nr:flagellar motor protein MotB [Spirochaetaceae bacterium]